MSSIDTWCRQSRWRCGSAGAGQGPSRAASSAPLLGELRAPGEFRPLETRHTDPVPRLSPPAPGRAALPRAVTQSAHGQGATGESRRVHRQWVRFSAGVTSYPASSEAVGVSPSVEYIYITVAYI